MGFQRSQRRSFNRSVLSVGERGEERRGEGREEERNHYVLEAEKLYMWTLGWTGERAPPKL